jgi:hypothetical protein
MSDFITNDIRENIKKQVEAVTKKEAIRRLHKEFADFDCSSLPKMTNKDLAAWQAKYPMDSPQYLIALQEWNRRATVEQTKWMKRSIYIGFLGIIIGAILTAFVTWLLPPQQSDNKISPQNQSTENRTQQNTEEKNTDIKAPIRQNK